MEYSCCISDYIWSRDLTTIKSTVVIMALFDQQQQQEEQPNQVQPYGVCVGSRRIRNVQQVPYVPDMNMGRPLFRARQLPAYPVREQQQHVMLQDRINQDVQHNMIQDNIAYNRRLSDDPQRGIMQSFRKYSTLDYTRDELAAWEVHLQQQQQLTPRGGGKITMEWRC